MVVRLGSWACAESMAARAFSKGVDMVVGGVRRCNESFRVVGDGKRRWDKACCVVADLLMGRAGAEADRVGGKSGAPRSGWAGPLFNLALGNRQGSPMLANREL